MLFLVAVIEKKIFNDFHKKLIRRIFYLIRTKQVLHYLNQDTKETEMLIKFMPKTYKFCIRTRGNFLRGGRIFQFFFVFVTLCLCHNFRKKIFTNNLKGGILIGEKRGKFFPKFRVWLKWWLYPIKIALPCNRIGSWPNIRHLNA